MNEAPQPGLCDSFGDGGSDGDGLEPHDREQDRVGSLPRSGNCCPSSEGSSHMLTTWPGLGQVEARVSQHHKDSGTCGGGTAWAVLAAWVWSSPVNGLAKPVPHMHPGILGEG